MENHGTSEFEDESRTLLKCGVCGEWVDVVRKDMPYAYGSKTVIFAEFPFLYCKGCDQSKPNPVAMKWADEYIKENQSSLRSGERLVSKSRDRRFNFCKNIPFLYHPSDNSDIPGLYRSGGGGYLTPVFFRRYVLLKYFHHPDYLVRFHSSTYGAIRKKDGFSIDFGINKRDEVLMWLGDIDELPPEEQHYLRSENIPSSSDVGSQFYLGQIEGIFTALPPEREMLKEREAFEDAVFTQRGFKIHQLDLEVVPHIDRIIRPIVWTREGVASVVNAMQKVCVETISVSVLKNVVSQLKPSADTKGLKGLKLVQLWVELRGHSDAPSLLLPFFVLYDLRIWVDHLLSAHEEEETLESCFNRLGLTHGQDSIEKLYGTLVRRLVEAYQELARRA